MEKIEKLPEKILRLKNDFRYTMLQVSVKAGVSESTLNRVVRGEVSDPGIETVQRIASAFGMTTGELIKHTTVDELIPDKEG